MKLTQLYQLTSSNLELSDNDLILISDYSENGMVSSRAASLKDIRQYIDHEFITSQQFQELLNAKGVTDVLSANINAFIKQKLNELVLNGAKQDDFLTIGFNEGVVTGFNYYTKQDMVNNIDFSNYITIEQHNQIQTGINQNITNIKNSLSSSIDNTLENIQLLENTLSGKISQVKQQLINLSSQFQEQYNNLVSKIAQNSIKIQQLSTVIQSNIEKIEQNNIQIINFNNQLSTYVLTFNDKIVQMGLDIQELKEFGNDLQSIAGISLNTNLSGNLSMWVDKTENNLKQLNLKIQDSTLQIDNVIIQQLNNRITANQNDIIQISGKFISEQVLVEMKQQLDIISGKLQLI